jgi:hypothetical protein
MILLWKVSAEIKNYNALAEIALFFKFVNETFGNLLLQTFVKRRYFV